MLRCLLRRHRDYIASDVHQELLALDESKRQHMHAANEARESSELPFVARSGSSQERPNRVHRADQVQLDGQELLVPGLSHPHLQYNSIERRRPPGGGGQRLAQLGMANRILVWQDLRDLSTGNSIELCTQAV